MKRRIMLLDVLPDELSIKEIAGYISPEIALIVNLPQNGCHAYQAQRHFESVSINIHDEEQILAVARQFGGFDAIKLRKNVPLRKELLCALTADDLATRLKVIGQAGVGLNHIDTGAAEELGIDVFNTPGANATAVAEFTLLQMLALLRQTNWHQDQMRRGHWSKSARPPARSLGDISVGLAGSGAISRALIALLKPFQCPVTVLGSSRFTDKDADELGVMRAVDLLALLSGNDMISLHLPLNSDTHYMLNASVLPCIRKGAYLLNMSRGGLIDETALAAFMQQHPGWISGVALDTFEAEREPFYSPLQESEYALLTPHIAGTTETALLTSALRVQQGILSRLAAGAEK
ncbi:NAD(P)-dependent oxidoreductase [Pantoea agglomerans]|uniref:D-3-phosphoglycerate dehydrogenase n=1 Tax=Enterobacter agglomerans TaxID=549 RepID=A0ABD6XS26_ENTAG|nr:NAD(P)-dependent oxidoreductase [Pantoea agglomerans]MCH9405934.1 hypothetical protein [Pantoea agglomerans]WNK32679.1 NAD(P)-dependent oxidoreductase [Pantoea agglomerans]WNK55538.1 NAD(P)-dependent oxidoreductase [Pantoea agglomerans]WNK64450.1 NAD(P)-dependent oxidoreductase [Pantoea agglomerans]WNK73486.1 NAD(P)-dependent oxidoreductase [Pantoea agglomerans]